MGTASLTPETYRPFDPETLSCPHAGWAMLRRESPIHRFDIPGIPVPTFFVTRKKDLQYIAEHPEIFCGAPPSAAWRWGPDMGPELNPIFDEGGYRPAHTFVTSDPPLHTYYRRVINEGISQKKVVVLKPAIQEIIDELTAALPSAENVNFMKAYCIPLPLRVIGIILGLPREDDHFLAGFADAYMVMVDPSSPLASSTLATRLVVEGQKYLAELLLRYREQPADNLMSDYANARGVNGELLSMGEALSMATITVIGGNETTRHALGNSAYLLARQPELWDRLKREPAKIANFVEESLRTHAPATATARGVLEDTEINGTMIPKGSAIYMIWGAGSTDPEGHVDPLVVDLDRKDGRNHLSFGYGIHFCAGNRLARAELIQSITTWLTEFERIELAAPESDYEFAPVFAFRAFKELPLKFIRKQGG